jgi:hypothetical protein
VVGKFNGLCRRMGTAGEHLVRQSDGERRKDLGGELLAQDPRTWVIASRRWTKQIGACGPETAERCC